MNLNYMLFVIVARVSLPTKGALCHLIKELDGLTMGYRWTVRKPRKGQEAAEWPFENTSLLY